MKTDRLTLLIAPADKAAIAARADALGMSVSELVRQASLAFDPEEAAAKAELEALLPEVGAAIDRIELTLDRMLARSEEYRRQMNWLQSDEHRQQVAREVENDARIDWDWIARLRSGVLHHRSEAA